MERMHQETKAGHQGATPPSGHDSVGAEDRIGLQKPQRQAAKAKPATPTQLMEKLESQSFRCGLSGRELAPETATLDHIVPVSEGGTDEIHNLWWIHVDLNRCKGTLPLDEFIALCRSVVTSNPRHPA